MISEKLYETWGTQWVEYIKLYATENSIIAEGLTHYYLEDITIQELEQMVTCDSNVMTVYVFAKKKRIENIL